MGNGLSIGFYSSNTTTEIPMNQVSNDIPFIPLEVELTTRQAAERYGCDNNYSTFHNRMTKLGIKPERRGRSSYLSSIQIQLMDRLDEHLKGGGTFSNFIIKEGEPEHIVPNHDISELATRSNSPIVSNTSIGSVEIITALQALSNSNYDVLTPQKRLKEAAEEGFLLTTEQVSKIVGLSHSTISSWKSGTQKLGFYFEKQREGSSVVWKVGRI